MEDHISIRPDRSLLLGRQTAKWSLLDEVFQENNSNQKLTLILTMTQFNWLWLKLSVKTTGLFISSFFYPLCSSLIKAKCKIKELEPDLNVLVPPTSFQY